MSENKVNLIIAVRGYKSVKKEKKHFGTDVTALDSSNKKVLLRVMEPLASEYIGVNEIRSVSNLIKQEQYDFAILISKRFTDSALQEMVKENIEHVSEDYMLPFDIQELYQAIVDCANNQCQKKCGKTQLLIPECTEKAADLCKIRALASEAKGNFEKRTVGLLKNNLKTAIALNR